MVKTAECVSPAHPDKLCDRISDTLLDAYLTHDPDSRVAIEAIGSHGKIFVTGEVTSTAPTLPVADLVRQVVKEDHELVVHIARQSPEIARGVSSGGAGDQGIMMGYATRETASYMPREYELARQVCQAAYVAFPYDGKAQVTLAPDGEIFSVVCSFQHAPASELRTLVQSVLPQAREYHINPAGDWLVGGFAADAGLTGRKIVVDNYGPEIAVGGGAFSGKDPSKVDRSGAYMARRIAVDYLEARPAAETVAVKLAYAIGHPDALMAVAVVDGVPEMVTGYDLTPSGLIDHLSLTTPLYAQTAEWGHFGRGFAWG